MSDPSRPPRRRFSDRTGGGIPVRALQVDDLDHDTRNRLWNGVEQEVALSVSLAASPMVRHIQEHPDVAFATRLFAALLPPVTHLLPFVRLFWVDHLGLRASEVSDLPPAELMQELETVITEGSIAELMDLLEILLEAVELRDSAARQVLLRRIDDVFERTNTAYRITSGLVLPITENAEREVIVQALDVSEGAPGPHQQLQAALRHLRADEWAAAVNASYLAVEGAARWCLGENDRATLPDALKELRRKRRIPAALAAAWSSYYGFASNADNIRHGGRFESGATRELASYFVVTSSALVVFLLKLPPGPGPGPGPGRDPDPEPKADRS